MNQKEREKLKDKLFYYVNDSGHDLEDFIDRLSDSELKIQAKLWKEKHREEFTTVY